MKFVADLLNMKKSTKTLIFALFFLATITLASQLQRASTEENKSESKNQSFMKRADGTKKAGQLCKKDTKDDCIKGSGFICKKQSPDFQTGK